MYACALDNWASDFLQPFAGQLVGEILPIHKGRVEAHTRLGRETMLRLDHQLALLPASNWQSAICNQCLIHVVPAEVSVATGRKHLKDAVIQLQNRNVEGAASQVVDGDFRF